MKMQTKTTSLASFIRELAKDLSERLQTATKTERLLFACCVFYGGVLLIFKIMGV